MSAIEKEPETSRNGLVFFVVESYTLGVITIKER